MLDLTRQALNGCQRNARAIWTLASVALNQSGSKNSNPDSELTELVQRVFQALEERLFDPSGQDRPLQRTVKDQALKSRLFDDYQLIKNTPPDAQIGWTTFCCHLFHLNPKIFQNSQRRNTIAYSHVEAICKR